MASTSNATKTPSSTMASTSNAAEIPSSTMASTSNAAEIPSSTMALTSYFTEVPSSMHNPLLLEHVEEITRKRIRIEKSQDKSLIHGFQLQPYLSEILHSNDTLQETLKDLVETGNPSILNVLKSIALHYPNAFALKLVELLEVLPPLPIRIEAISILLHVFNESGSLNRIILVELKKPLLNSLNLESNVSVLRPLCQMIGLLAYRLYRHSLGSWTELIQYICDCFLDGLNFLHMKALYMFVEIPLEVVQNNDFWLNDYYFDTLCMGIIKVSESKDKEVQDLTFKGCLKVLKMSGYLERTESYNSFLFMLLGLIERQHGQKEEKDLLDMVNDLLSLARLRIKNMFKSKVKDIVCSMFRVAELENASNELMCAAVTVIKELNEEYREGMKSVFQKLSQEKEEVKRVICIAMRMMSCVVEDPVWYDIDSEDCQDAGSTENFRCGHCLLNLLSSYGDERVVVPIAMEMVGLKCAVHDDWNVRYATMLTIAAIAEKHFQGDMIQYIYQAATLVLNSLNDKNFYVLWATMRAIIGLSEYKEILKSCKYHMKFLDKLIPIIKNRNCPRVQAYAIMAIRFLVRNCGLEQMLSYGEEVLTLLLKLLKNKMQKLKEEALEALKLIADLIPAGTFCQNYYDATMEALTTVLFDNSITSNLFIRDKCLEIMTTLAMNFEKVDVLVESLVLIEGNLSDTENVARYDIFKALDQFCKSPKVNIDQFVDGIMPMMLKCAEAIMLMDFSLDDYLVEKLSVRVCSILSSCAFRSAKKITPNIDKVIAIFLRWIEYSSIETRKACISALPNLLLSIKESVPERDTMINAAHHIMTSLTNAIKKETNIEMHKKMFKLLPKCIQISGKYFRNELIIDITTVISQMLKNIMQNEITREATGAFEVGSDFLPTEEIIKDAGFLIAKTIEKFSRIPQIQFLAHMDQLMGSVALFLRSNMPDRVIAFALSIFNILAPLSPKRYLCYHDVYVATACAALEKYYPHSWLHATRAIGISAKSGKEILSKRCLKESIKTLESVISRDAADLHDTAVAAYGRICFYCPNSVDNEVVIKWVSLLPLKHNLVEAKHAHSLFVRLLKRCNPELVEPQSDNVSTIMYVVKQILDGPGELIDEDDKCELASFADHQGR